MKNILILGNGFIGEALSKSLVALGHQVKVFSRKKGNVKGIQYREGDWLSLVNHQDFFENVTIVIHALSTSVPYTSMLNKEQDAAANILLNIKLLDILIAKNIPRIIYISSGGAIYGNPITSLVNENHPTQPLSSYGITKLTTEKYLSIYQENNKLQTISLRPSNIYGHGQSTNKPQGIIGHIVNSLKMNNSLTIWGDGHGKKDYLYIDDFVDAVVKVVNNPHYTKKVYNVSSGECFSVIEIVQLIEQLTNKKIKLVFAKHKKFDVSEIQLDNTLFKTTFGWQPTTSLKKGIALYLTNNP